MVLAMVSLWKWTVVMLFRCDLMNCPAMYSYVSLTAPVAVDAWQLPRPPYAVLIRIVCEQFLAFGIQTETEIISV